MNRTGSASSTSRRLASRNPGSGTAGSRPSASHTSSRCTADSSSTTRSASSQVVAARAPGPRDELGTGAPADRGQAALGFLLVAGHQSLPAALDGLVDGTVAHRRRHLLGDPARGVEAPQDLRRGGDLRRFLLGPGRVDQRCREHADVREQRGHVPSWAPRRGRPLRFGETAAEFRPARPDLSQRRHAPAVVLFAHRDTVDVRPLDRNRDRREIRRSGQPAATPASGRFCNCGVQHRCGAAPHQPT